MKLFSNSQRMKLFDEFFEKSSRKVCSFKNYIYLCNPKTNKAVVVKW